MSDQMPTNDISSDDKLWVLLSYVAPVLVHLILYFAMKDRMERPFVRAHFAQSLVYGILTAIGGSILSTILFFCLGLPWLVLWGIGVYWGIQAYNGNYVTIPVITDFCKNQGWA